VRMALLDTKRFSNGVGNAAGDTVKAIKPENEEHARQLAEGARTAERLQKLYEEQGWVPVPTLDAHDEPRHMQLRRLFNHAFRPERIKELDPFLESLVERLIDDFIDDGQCEFVRALAVPLPLIAIGKQVGVPEEDMPRIKTWTDAWIRRLGLSLNEEEQVWSAELEIEAQHYFQPIIERLREEPDDTLLSDLVNSEIPEWGRTLTDAELHSELMADLFVGGSETTTNALSAGIMLLIQNPEVWQRLKADPDAYLDRFIEEVLRVESPVQGLLREAAVDIELHGVTIPAGSVINVRFASANRDDRRFDCPADIDLGRERPKSHLAFGVGTHHCLGAPLARRELYFGFKGIAERIDEMWFIEGANEFTYEPSYFLRALKELHIGFEASAA
jgi:cytochrome P450